MRSLFCVLILILVFCAATFAQTNENLPCPTISITDPPGIVLPGETAIFTGEISKEAKKLNLQFKWTIQGGEIIQGQETLTVKVFQNPENAGESPTMTLEVIGLPKGCENSDSLETSITLCFLPTPIIFDEFSIANAQIDKVKLDNFAVKLRDDSWSMGYIIEKFEKKTSTEAIKQKNLKTIEYLKLQGIEEVRIVLQNSFADKNLTQFVLVPAGATPPICDDCISSK